MTPNSPDPGGTQGKQAHPDDGLAAALEALLGRLTAALSGPEAHRVAAELQRSAQDLAGEIDRRLDGPDAQALKDRLAALMETIRRHLH